MIVCSEVEEGGLGREILPALLIVDGIVSTGRKEEKHICLSSAYLTVCSKN